MRSFRAYLRSLDPRLPREVYVLAAGALVNAFGNGGSTEWAAGASLGYRQLIRDALALRLEARYRRHLASHLPHICPLLGIWPALHRTPPAPPPRGGPTTPPG